MVLLVRDTLVPQVGAGVFLLVAQDSEKIGGVKR